jgi:hypothetical protein
MTNPLQKFVKKPDTWRFMRAARSIQTETPAQKLILLLLASHIDGRDGSCYPSYKLLMQESGYTSKTTVTDALQYLRDTLKIVTWKKGWGNSHGSRSNRYLFNEETMRRLADESPLDEDESPLDDSRKSTSQGGNPTGVVPKNQRIRTSYTEVPALERGSAPFLESKPAAGQKPTKANLEESTPNELSSLSTLGELSSPAYNVRDALVYDRCDKQWYARPDIGRALSPDEQAERLHLNANHVRP